MHAVISTGSKDCRDVMMKESVSVAWMFHLRVVEIVLEAELLVLCLDRVECAYFQQPRDVMKDLLCRGFQHQVEIVRHLSRSCCGGVVSPNAVAVALFRGITDSPGRNC